MIQLFIKFAKTQIFHSHKKQPVKKQIINIHIQPLEHFHEFFSRSTKYFTNKKAHTDSPLGFSLLCFRLHKNNKFSKWPRLGQVVKVTPSVMLNVLYKCIHYLLTTTVSKIVRNYLKKRKNGEKRKKTLKRLKKRRKRKNGKNGKKRKKRKTRNIILQIKKKHPFISKHHSSYHKNNFTAESKRKKVLKKSLSLSLPLYQFSIPHLLFYI